MSGYRLPMRRNENDEPPPQNPSYKSGHSGGMRMIDINEAMLRVFDSEPTVTRCAFCEEWEHAGTAADGRAAAAEHRQAEHPDIKITPRKRGKKTPARKVS